MPSIRAVAALLALAIGAAPRGARADVFGDITVAPEAPPKMFGDRSARHGYTEYRIALQNRSTERSHQVTLVFPSDAGSPGNRVERLSRSVVLGPSATVVVPLLQPPLTMVGSGLTVWIDGRRYDQFWSVGGYSRSSYRAAAGPQLLLSPNIDNGGFQRFAHEALKDKHGRLPLVYDAANSPVAEWSTSWLAYSGYDGVVVHASELDAAPAAVRAALSRYVECGGVVVVIGRWERPRELRPLEAAADGLDGWYAGFGQWSATGDSGLADLTAERWRRLSEAWQRSSAPWRGAVDERLANERFRIVERDMLPVRGLLLVMLLFLIAIGANLVLLARFKKRIWIFWTVPALSLLTAIGVSMAALLAEDWTGRLRLEGLTLLDEGSRRATTLGWQAIYMPLAPSDGLRYGYDTELTPLVRTDFRRGLASRSIDWTGGQHLSGGWVTARIPAHFMVRRSEIRRERLTVRPGGGGALEVVNGLGSDIRALWVADGDGTIHSAERIPAGAQAALVRLPRERRAQGRPANLRSLYVSDWLTLLDPMIASPEQHLFPGSYIAALDEAPFMEEGSTRPMQSRRCRSVVFGFGAGGPP